MEHPKSLGSYELLEDIGSGGMGTVYKARHQRTNQMVALKVLPTELAREPRFLKRFAREIDVLKRLDHPNIARILDAGSTEENFHYYAMELVDGLSLEQVLQREHRLSIDDAMNVIRQCARALDYAHQQKVIHRDIKPGNILVSLDWQVKVTDFGIARPEEATRMTTTGSIMGTAEYMSPEQAEGKRVDARSDIYSLGVVFYRMLAGRNPFAGETVMEVLKHHRFSIPDSPKSYNPDISINLAAIIMKMLAKAPEERFDSMTAVLRALEIVERGGMKTDDEARAVDARRRESTEREQRMSTLLSAAKWITLGVACIVVLVVYYARKKPPETPREKLGRAVIALSEGRDGMAKTLLYQVLNASKKGTELYEEARQKLHVVKQKELAEERAQAEITGRLYSNRYRKNMNSLVALQCYQVALSLLENGEHELAVAHFTAVGTLFGDTEWGNRSKEKLQEIELGVYSPQSQPATSSDKPPATPVSKESSETP